MTSRHAEALLFLENLAANPPQLPFEPSLLPALFTYTSRDSDASMEAVADLVNRSQGLAVHVLRLANSAYYGLATKVSSLTRAMIILGMNELRNLVLAYGAAAALKKFPLPPNFSVHTLWEHQVRTAIIARELGRIARDAAVDTQPAGPDELYAAGLLHDLGKLIIASRRPHDWRSIHDLAAAENLPLITAEEQYWGIDHCTVGARLLSFWDIPPQLTELVSWHHTPQLAEFPYKAGVALLAAANTLADSGIRNKALAAGTLTARDIPPDIWKLLPQELHTEKTLTRLHTLFAHDAAAGKADALTV